MATTVDGYFPYQFVSRAKYWTNIHFRLSQKETISYYVKATVYQTRHIHVARLARSRIILMSNLRIPSSFCNDEGILKHFKTFHLEISGRVS